jgi:hypothetical protein
MNNTLHTPAPWDIHTCNENGPHLDSFFLSASNDDNECERIICRFPTGTGQFSDMGRENLANACLISAAPDLLSALKFLLADYIAIEGERLTGSDAPLKMALSAISKAEGRAI